MTNSPLVLVHAEATNVLGEYDHSLAFPEEDGFVIIYGPNGVGKTKFLEIVHATSQLDGRALAKLPFESATLTYSNGSSLHVSIPSGNDSDDIFEDLDESPVHEANQLLNFTLNEPGEDTAVWFRKAGHHEEWLAERTSWRQITADTWEDRQDGEIATLSELEQRYPPIRQDSARVPKRFAEFKVRATSFLIETQRLKTGDASGILRRHQRPSNRKSSSKISEQSANMQQFVNAAQTRHSVVTQQLDRTFPSRVLRSTVQTVAADAKIRNLYNEQNEFRSRLGRVVSVPLASELSLPERELQDWELRLLTLYLEDANKKLEPFEGLLHRIELLEKIINSRLLNKKLQVTAGDGLSVFHQPSQRKIELDSLSSGEQHEIILMFDLLFNVPSGALVLIDEPEISLHVVWQLAFVPDVEQIAALAGFRFVVATHSPQIINDAWDRSVRLGPSGAEFA